MEQHLDALNTGVDCRKEAIGELLESRPREDTSPVVFIDIPREGRHKFIVGTTAGGVKVVFALPINEYGWHRDLAREAEKLFGKMTGVKGGYIVRGADGLFHCSESSETFGGTDNQAIEQIINDPANRNAAALFLTAHDEREQAAKEQRAAQAAGSAVHLDQIASEALKLEGHFFETYRLVSERCEAHVPGSSSALLLSYSRFDDGFIQQFPVDVVLMECRDMKIACILNAGETITARGTEGRFQLTIQAFIASKTEKNTQSTGIEISEMLGKDSKGGLAQSQLRKACRLQAELRGDELLLALSGREGELAVHYDARESSPGYAVLAPGKGEPVIKGWAIDLSSGKVRILVG